MDLAEPDTRVTIADITNHPIPLDCNTFHNLKTYQPFYYMASLNEFIAQRGIYVSEGYSQQIPQQTEDLKKLVKNATNILEIGFNAGHSSEIFLTHSLANVVSFDLGFHHYVIDGKQYIDGKFPGRHTLILGDSHRTIPTFKEFSNKKFDFLFIDGDHSFEGALKDLMDCQNLATPNAVIAFDDVVYKPEFDTGWTIGPKQAWKSMIAMGKIEEHGYMEYQEGRGMVYGKYIQ